MDGFGEARSDGFNPEYGGVEWKRRLNNHLEEMNVDLRIRGEKLDINDFADLANRIYKKTQN